VEATRRIAKTAVCDRHYAGRLGIKLPAEETMRKKTEINEAVRSNILADRAAGMKINPIAKKYSLTWHVVNELVTGAPVESKAKPGRRSSKAAPHGDLYSVPLNAAGMDAVWNSLPAEKKAQLLKGLNQ
jgi:hypothetical protein